MDVDGHRHPVCIVGTGHAGAELAFSLRQQGYSGPLVLIGEEPHLPYQRPPLSKAFLKGGLEPEALLLRQPPAYRKADIQLLLGHRVRHIDRESRQLLFEDGREVRYSRLALATGGRARRMAIDGATRAEQCGNFHYLRSIDDAMAIRTRFEPGRRLVVIGGGYVGLEVAAAAIARNMQVTLLEALPRVLARVTAPVMSRFYEQIHRNAGVDLHTGVEVSGLDFDPAGLVCAVHSSDGAAVPADLVVVGIGMIPNTELAAAAGLDVDDGIAVDEFALTSDPQIVAAGDCTSHPNASCGRRIRLESIPNAVEQARVAAAWLAGKPRAHDAVPWFWSDQYDLKLQMTGLSHGYDQVVLRGSTHGRSFAAFYLRAGRLIACDAVNRAQEFTLARRMIGAGQTLDPATLADESMPLKSLVPSRSQ